MTQKSDIPKVSIGMPVFNGEMTIRDALDCLLAQTFTDYELIISDNASTDNTKAICQEYVKKDTRIRYVRQESNLGAGSNFDFVHEQAKGEYFMWAAADDKWDARYIAILSEVLDVNPEVGLAFSDMYTENLYTGDKFHSSCGYIVSSQKYKRYLYRLLNNSPSIFYGLYRKSILDSFDVVLDFDYSDIHMIHWFELNSSIKIVPLPLYIAGTKGERIPFSISGNKISSDGLLRAERKLQSKHFGWFTSQFFCALLKFMYRRNDRQLNQKLALQKAIQTGDYAENP